MSNLSQNGRRCRATKEIRTHEGLIGRFTEGPFRVLSITWGVNLLTSNGIAVLPRTRFSMRLKSQMAHNFLPRSTSDLVEPLEIPILGMSL